MFVRGAPGDGLIKQKAGDRLNIKMLSYPYKDSNYSDKTISWPFAFIMGILYLERWCPGPYKA